MQLSTSRVVLMTMMLCAAAVQLFGHAPPHKVFSSRSEVVVVHVTVLDGKARLVSGLPKDAFTVFEDGQPEAVSFFQHEDHPVTVGLVLDCSGSMQRKRDAVIAAGMAFAR